MKKLFYFLKSSGLVAACVGMFGVSANAATFTAVASGNFSAAATWGGVAPSQMVSTDVVIIPSNITVTLDQNQTFNGALSSLVVNGTLMSSTTSSNALIMTMGSFSGSGTIDVDSLALGMTSGFGFTGYITADALSTMGANLSTAATVMVNNSLYLTGGVLNMASGSLTLGSNSNIVISGGSIATNGGTLGLSNSYNLMYTGSSSVSGGLELGGSGLNNIEVALGTGSSLNLSSDLNVDGTLTLTSGNLNLNNNDLTFSGAGNFSATGSGAISSTTSSDIIIMTTGSITGALRFSATGNNVNNFTVNMGSGSASVMLGSDLNVDGDLVLTMGRVDVGTNDLLIGGTVGGSANSYVVTGVGGTVSMNMSGGGSGTFQIGTSASYAPAMVTANSGSGSGTVSVSVNPEVYVNSMSGAKLSTDQPLVGNTWFVTNTATTTDINLTLMWSASNEVNGFNRSKAYVSHYINGKWDATASASATTTSNGMFSLTRNNITSLSPFAVMDEKAVTTSVSNIYTAGGNFTLYPNPAADVVYFNSDRPVRVEIYSLNGLLMKTAEINGGTNAVSISELPMGLYSARVFGNGYQAVHKLVKQ
jgi:hypothetical protein